MDTNSVVDRLTADASPVQRLRSEPARATLWMLLALISVVGMAYLMTLRSDLSAKLGDTRYVVEQVAAILTAFTAAMAAFSSTVPGRSRYWLALPIIPVLVWLGSIGAGCLSDAFSGRTTFASDWSCFPAIVMVGLIPAMSLVLMLRAGAPLFPHATTGLAGLAAAAIGDFGLRLFHPTDSGLMVLVWQMGSVVLLAIFARMSVHICFAGKLNGFAI